MSIRLKIPKNNLKLVGICGYSQLFRKILYKFLKLNFNKNIKRCKIKYKLN